MSTTWIDWALLMVLALSVLTGFARGFIREGLKLAAWVVALLVARATAPAVAALMADQIASEEIRLVVAFVLVVVGVMLLAGMVIRLLHAVIEWAGMGFFNRLLGALFGALRAALIAVLAVTVAGLTPLAGTQAWQTSALLPLVEQGRALLIAQYHQLDEQGALRDDVSRRALELQQDLPSRLGEPAEDPLRRP